MDAATDMMQASSDCDTEETRLNPKRHAQIFFPCDALCPEGNNESRRVGTPEGIPPRRLGCDSRHSSLVRLVRLAALGGLRRLGHGLFGIHFDGWVTLRYHVAWNFRDDVARVLWHFVPWDLRDYVAWNFRDHIPRNIWHIGPRLHQSGATRSTANIHSAAEVHAGLVHLPRFEGHFTPLLRGHRLQFEVRNLDLVIHLSQRDHGRLSVGRTLRAELELIGQGARRQRLLAALTCLKGCSHVGKPLSVRSMCPLLVGEERLVDPGPVPRYEARVRVRATVVVTVEVLTQLRVQEHRTEQR